MDILLNKTNNLSHINDKINSIMELILSSSYINFIQKIYLFGSCAYGKPKKNSDIDLCIIMNDNVDKMKVYVDIGLILFNNKILDYDLLIYNKCVFDNAIKKNGVENIIFNKGKLLYVKEKSIK